MGTSEISVDVNVPISQAYDQWTQFEDFPEFMEDVDTVTQLDDRRLRWDVTVAGVSRSFEAEITEQHPEERVAWRTTAGTGQAGVVTFHKLDDSHTRVTAQMDVYPEGIVEKVADRVGLVDRAVKRDLKNFKEFVESRDGATGSWRGDVPREG